MLLIWIDSSSLGKKCRWNDIFIRKADVGNYKSKVAADFVMKRIPHVKITSYTEPIQSYDEEFYKQFILIIAGLDNIEARRWIN